MIDGIEASCSAAPTKGVRSGPSKGGAQGQKTTWPSSSMAWQPFHWMGGFRRRRFLPVETTKRWSSSNSNPVIFLGRPCRAVVAWRFRWFNAGGLEGDGRNRFASLEDCSWSSSISNPTIFRGRPCRQVVALRFRWFNAGGLEGDGRNRLASVDDCSRTAIWKGADSIVRQRSQRSRSIRNYNDYQLLTANLKG